MINDIISFWLYQCNERDAAYDLLTSYQYSHKWTQYGDLGGIYAKPSGKYFEPDDNGDLFIAQAIWYDIPCILNYVEEPLLFDVIAWKPEAPRQWYFYRGESGLILGEKAIFEASIHKKPLILHSTPFAWLRSGCKGCVLLDCHGLNRLYGLKNVICEDVAHGTRIEQGLSLYYRKNMPHLSVPAQNGGIARW